jgi:hypothetical protein
VQGDLAGGLFGLGLRAVDLRVHERVRRREVGVAHELLVGHHVLGALLVPPPRPDVGTAGEAGERHVQVIRRAAHHPGRERRRQLDRAPAPLEVVPRARDQVRDVHEATVVGRRSEHLVRVLVLEVEHPRHRLRGGAQLEVLERMGDPFPVQPNLAGVAAQTSQELFSCPRGSVRLRAPCLLGAGRCHQAPLSLSGIPRASRPCRSDSTASASKRKYERGGRMPQTFDECGSSGHSRGS